MRRWLLSVCADAGNAGAVEFGEGKAFEGLIPTAAHVAKNGDGHGFAGRERIGVVVAPVNRGLGASHTDIRGELIHFTAYGELVDVRAGVRNELGAVFAGLRNVEVVNRGEGSGVVEPGFDDGGAGSGNGGVTLAVRRMLRAAFWERVGHEVRAVGGEGTSESLGIENVAVNGVAGLAGLGHVDEATVCLGAEVAMHEPFLEPDGFQSALRDFGDDGFQMRRAEGA